MRDAARIPGVLDYVNVVWRTRPDLRLGQLLLNTVTLDSDLFYLEDGELLERLLRTYMRDGEHR